MKDIAHFGFLITLASTVIMGFVITVIQALASPQQKNAEDYEFNSMLLSAFFVLFVLATISFLALSIISLSSDPHEASPDHLPGLFGLLSFRP